MIATPRAASFRVVGRVAGLVVILLAGIVSLVCSPLGLSRQSVPAGEDAALLEGFRHVEVASVSDALEQISGRKMYMSHRMRPLFPTRFTGLAVTVLFKKESNHDPDALRGVLAAIDEGARDFGYVMVGEGGGDIAGIGGLVG